MYAPLSLNVTVTLIFDLETPNSIGVIYYCSYDQPPYQVRRSLGYELITDRTKGPTDRQVQSNIPLFFGGGHNKGYHESWCHNVEVEHISLKFNCILTYCS